VEPRWSIMRETSREEVEENFLALSRDDVEKAMLTCGCFAGVRSFASAICEHRSSYSVAILRNSA